MALYTDFLPICLGGWGSQEASSPGLAGPFSIRVGRGEAPCRIVGHDGWETEAQRPGSAQPCWWGWGWGQVFHTPVSEGSLSFPRQASAPPPM